MNTSIALSPVQFHGQSLLATLVNDIPHVALKPICENIGLDWSSQVQKIKRNQVLNSTMVMITTVAEDGKLREMLMMPIKYLNGWLFGVDANRVKPEVKDRVIEYQRECFDVLANHFMPKPQYGLKSLPPSPYISEAEASQFKKSLEQHCKGERQQYSLLYRKVYDYYGVTSYKHIPVGKLPEAARLIGIKLVAVKKPKLPPEPQLICMTPLELLAHDEQVAEEAIKRVQGELVSEPVQHDSITINLAPLAENEPMKRMMITQHHSGLVQLWKTKPETVAEKKALIITELKNEGYVVIERERLKNLSIEKLNDFIKFV